MFTMALANIRLFLGSTYGSGVFGAGTYNGGVQIGPITLPVTGAGLSIILGAFALAIAAGMFARLHQKRKQSQLDK